MKKRIIILAIIVLALLIMFLPIPRGTYRDGGTKDYSALTYRIVVWNRLNEQINEEGSDKYHKTSVFWFPDNFKSIDELWEIERSRNGYFNISSYTMAKLNKDLPVSMATMMNLCKVFHCDIGDLVEIIEED